MSTSPTLPSQTSAPARPVIEIDDVVRTFGDMTALDGVRLSVERGAILGLIGPSGAGKTTIVRLLTGAIGPTSGTVEVLGEDPRRFRRQTRQRIGYMPQLFTLYPDLTASENVDFVASMFGILWRTRHRRTREVLELVGLWDARSRRASQLSGGMQRRLELACALVHQPDVLFLDEPTAGIDPLLRGRIWEELHRLREIGRTIVVTTQYVNEAEECDSVALISDGRLLALAPPDALRREALGGDVVEIQTRGVFDGASLEELAIVRRVEQDGPRDVKVVVEDASEAIPDIVEMIGRQGGEVVAAREARPSFDAVFSTLVEQDRERRNGSADEASPDDQRWDA
jgi:ABC-2 type transport system ATP-binding protein